MRPIDVKPGMTVMVRTGPVRTVLNACGDAMGEVMETTWLGLPLKVLAIDHPFVVVELYDVHDRARFVVGRSKSDPWDARRHILDLREYQLTRVKPSYLRAVTGSPKPTRGKPSAKAPVDQQAFYRP